MSPKMDMILSEVDIQEKVARLAKDISNDYSQKEIVLVGVLKGSFIFLADLARALTTPVQIDFIRLASYGSATTTSGQVKITKKLETDISDCHVIVVEDIIDSGLTIAYLLRHLKQFKPASIRVCALIDKTERREVDVEIDYVGHTVKAGFLVGYGLDLDERYRELPGLYHLKT